MLGLGLANPKRIPSPHPHPNPNPNQVGRHFAPPLTKRASWQWYLKQAGRTAAAMWRYAGRGRDTSQWGLMVGSAFQLVLDDLEREGFEEEAAPLREMVKQRLGKWAQMVFPYGSEFPWDSTGQVRVRVRVRVRVS